MKIKFNSWFDYYKEPQSDEDTLSEMDSFNGTNYEKSGIPLETAAKEAHEKGMVYFVTIYQKSRPFAYLKINDGFFNVNFLDENLRLFRMFVWNRGAGGQIFLHEAQSWVFDGDTDKINSSTFRYFYPEGKVKIEKVLLPGRETSKTEKNLDVSNHWVDYPEFGEYEAIIDMDLVDWEVN